MYRWLDGAMVQWCHVRARNDLLHCWARDLTNSIIYISGTAAISVQDRFSQAINHDDPYYCVPLLGTEC